MVICWDSFGTSCDFEGEDVVFVGVFMSVGGCEVVNCSRKDVDVLLGSLIGCAGTEGTGVSEFYFQEVPSLVGWIVKSIVIEILSGDVDLIV